MKLNELRQIIREEIKQVIVEADKRFGLKRGEYVLYGRGTSNIPLPIKITKIDIDGWVEFESLYSVGNKAEWVKKFIGTEMEGLVYDPGSSWFKFSEIKKVEGKKIYLLR
jgi:hypothetical protein